MLDLLIRGLDKPGVAATEDDAMMTSNRKGAISAIFDAGPETPSKYLSGRQVPPDFCIIRCDVTRAQVAPYMQAWKQDLDWSITSLDVPTDAWQGEVYAKAVRSRDGRGSITRNQAENYLVGWNFTDLSFIQNRVQGNFTVFDLATSKRFWLNEDLTDIAFSELGYDETTGQHQIRMDYSGIGGAGRRRAGVTNVDDKVATLVADRAEVERHNTSQNRIDYNVWRGIPNHVPEGRGPLPGDDMVATLKAAVADELDERLGMKRWRVKPGVVDVVMAAGGFLEATPQELQSHMQDYCDA